MTAQTESVKVGELYQHYKGAYYIVVGITSDADSGEPRISYQEFGKVDLPVWSHLESNFIRAEDTSDGPKARFRLLSSDEVSELKRALTDRLLELNPVQRITLIQKALDDSLQALDHLPPLLGKMTISEEELAKLTPQDAQRIEALAREYQEFATLLVNHPVMSVLAEELKSLDETLGSAG